MEGRLARGLATAPPREPLGQLTVSPEWLALRNQWLAARDRWDLEDQKAAEQNKAPDAGPLLEAFAPILSYLPKTVLEWAEKVSLAEYRGHLAGRGIATVLWGDAVRVGLYAADRRAMTRGGNSADVVAAYHTREGLRSQHGVHPEGSFREAALLRVWDETTALILRARSSEPAITFTQLRVIMDTEISPIESDETTRSALAPLLAATAAQHLDDC